MPDSIVREGAGAGMAALLAVLATGMGWSVEAVAAAGAAGQLIGLLAHDSIMRRGESFVSTFRRELHEQNQGDFDDVIRERVADPMFRNVAYQTLRRVRDALDDAVVPALAILAKDYTIPDMRAADAFLRGACDLLSELDATDYADLLALGGAIASIDDGRATYFTLAVSEQTPGKMAVDGGEERGATPSIAAIVDAPDRLQALATLMRRHGLGADRPDTVAGAFFMTERNSPTAHWTVLLVVEFQVFRRLQSVLNRAARTATY